MAYACSEETKKHQKVRFEPDPMNRCPSSSCYTSSCSSSSCSSLEEPYDIDKFDVELSTEAKKPPPAPVTSSQEVILQTSTVWSNASSSSQSPQIPRPPGYDPNRLPTTMFAPKPSSAMDWSLASNESLFSINVGNSSFSSRDHYYNKSGELSKLDEMLLHAPTPLSPVTESQETKPSFNTLVDKFELKHHNDHEIVESKSESKEEKNVETVIRNIKKEEEIKETVKQEERKGPVPTDESNHSNRSFNYPVLAGHNDHHDHHDQAKQQLEEVKKKKQETPARTREQDQPEPVITESNAATKATKNSGWWSWFFACCCICR